MNGLRLYLRYAHASVRMQMLYPGAFLLLAATQFLNTLISIAAIWALFDRFDGLRGWRFAEIAVLFATANLSFGLADAINRGFDVFGPQFVKTGDFDRLLLRPRTAALQVLGFELRLTRIGRLAQALIVLIIALPLAHGDWTLAQGLSLVGAVVGGVALFSAILILQATLTFWTIDNLEAVNVVTYGGVEASQYPLDVYWRWLARFLIFIVPLGCVTYLPVVYALGRTDPLGAPQALLPFAPVVGFIFLAIALWAWSFGVRRYRSTGS